MEADKIDYERIVAGLASSDLGSASNACGILCTLTLASQQSRSAVSSAKDIIPNIEKALASDVSWPLPHNAALLSSMLAEVASFRRAFVRCVNLASSGALAHC